MKVLQTIGYINFNEKLTRKRTAANPHGAFEAAGAGNDKRAIAKQATAQMNAPVLDPTMAN